MKVNYTIRTHTILGIVEEGSFDRTNTTELYDFLKRAEAALIAGHIVTVVKGEE